MQDAEVPWQTAARIAECAVSDDIRLHLVKDAGHRFSEPKQLALLEQVISGLIAECISLEV